MLSSIRAVDPRIVIDLRTMSDDAVATINRERLLAWLGSAFALLGLLIALVGLYGTFAYAVIRRRTEVASGWRWAPRAPTCFGCSSPRL